MGLRVGVSQTVPSIPTGWIVQMRLVVLLCRINESRRRQADCVCIARIVVHCRDTFDLACLRKLNFYGSLGRLRGPHQTLSPTHSVTAKANTRAFEQLLHFVPTRWEKKCVPPRGERTKVVTAPPTVTKNLDGRQWPTKA